MAGWREQKVKVALGFPESHRVVVVFALGYEGDVKRAWDKLEQRIKDRLAEPEREETDKKEFLLQQIRKCLRS